MDRKYSPHVSRLDALFFGDRTPITINGDPYKVFHRRPAVVSSRKDQIKKAREANRKHDEVYQVGAIERIRGREFRRWIGNAGIP